MIKKIYTLLLLLVAVTAQATAPVIRNIAPHFWWAGMEEPQLQILLHGDKLAEYQVTISTTEVELQEVVTLPIPITYSFTSASKVPNHRPLIYSSQKAKSASIFPTS